MRILPFPHLHVSPCAHIARERLFVLGGWISTDVNGRHMLWMNKIRHAWEFIQGSQMREDGLTVPCPESHRMEPSDLISLTRIKTDEVSDRLHN